MCRHVNIIVFVIIFSSLGLSCALLFATVREGQGRDKNIRHLTDNSQSSENQTTPSEEKMNLRSPSILQHRPYQPEMFQKHSQQLKNQNSESGESRYLDSHTKPMGCPKNCTCKSRNGRDITVVDCSNVGLQHIPDLPLSTQRLFLEGNFITNLSCNNFQQLHRLKLLNLANNNISYLPSCLFQAQAQSLYILILAQNNIEAIDALLFRGLRKLNRLYLSMNVISTLEADIFSDLGQLQMLDLSFNLIHTMDRNAFNGLGDLIRLFLQNNRLDDDGSYDPLVFSSLSRLETLNIHGNEALPGKALSYLGNLSELYYSSLWQYSRQSLGPEFQNLTQLRLLHVGTVHWRVDPRYKRISLCDLNFVSGNVFKNINTTHDLTLNLTRCRWSQFIKADFFKSLKTLWSLDMTLNQINLNGHSTWTESLIDTRITYFNLTWSYVGRLYFVMDNRALKYLSQTNITSLKLGHSHYKGIGPGHYFPIALEELDMNNNKINFDNMYRLFLLADDGHLWKVRKLDLSNQRLLTQTNNSEDTGQMKEKSGTWNSTDARQIRGGLAIKKMSTSAEDSKTRTPSTQSELTQSVRPAREIPISSVHHRLNYLRNGIDCYNKNSSVSVKAICLPSYLETLFLSTSNLDGFTSIPHLRVYNNNCLKHIELANNHLSVWQGPIENVPSLSFLDLSQNQCNNMSVTFFKFMTNLQTLFLQENHLAEPLAADVEGMSFSTLKNLQILNLNNNDIKDLPTNLFVKNKKLKWLILSRNQLTDFQPSLSNIHNMSYLDLSRNLLRGLSEKTCQELAILRSRNPGFKVNIQRNRLRFTCDYRPMLRLLVSHPDMFEDVSKLKFTLKDTIKLHYKDVIQLLPQLEWSCMANDYFSVFLAAFFAVMGTTGLSAIVYHKRWKIRYLYYIGQRRLQLGGRRPVYQPNTDVFIIYDEDDVQWRHLVQRSILPKLQENNLSVCIGEVDFPGGDLREHAVGAITGSRRTLVLLSQDIFEVEEREFEMNALIMREFDTRSDIMVPVFVEPVDLMAYPREIETFLSNQINRFFYFEETPEFWSRLITLLRANN